MVEPVTRFGWFIIDQIFGCPDRRGDLRRGTTGTLDRLRVAAKREAAGLAGWPRG